jgi:hypothetical protein
MKTMITTFLKALVEMLNENPSITIGELKDNMKPFKVLGYAYEIECKASSYSDTVSTKIFVSGKGYYYVVDITPNGEYYFMREH